jgi:hypothetical protein
VEVPAKQTSLASSAASTPHQASIELEEEPIADIVELVAAAVATEADERQTGDPGKHTKKHKKKHKNRAKGKLEPETFEAAEGDGKAQQQPLALESPRSEVPVSPTSKPIPDGPAPQPTPDKDQETPL